MKQDQPPQIKKTIENADSNQNNFDLDRIWNENESKMKNDLITLMQPIFDKNQEFYTEIKKDQIIEKRLVAEKAFMATFLIGLNEVLKQNKSLVILCDVDETIGGRYVDKNDDMRTIIRPGFLTILEHLKPLRETGLITIGLLTTRKEPQTQLGETQNLQQISASINLDYVFSTTDKNKEIEGKDGIKGAMEILTNGSILKKEGVDTFQVAVDIASPGNQLKLLKLEEIKKRYPNTLFLVVDDEKYPSYLDSSNGLFGIQINRDAIWLHQ